MSKTEDGRRIVIGEAKRVYDAGIKGGIEFRVISRFGSIGRALRRQRKNAERCDGPRTLGVMAMHWLRQEMSAMSRVEACVMDGSGGRFQIALAYALRWYEDDVGLGKEVGDCDRTRMPKRA